MGWQPIDRRYIRLLYRRMAIRPPDTDSLVQRGKLKTEEASVLQRTTHAAQSADWIRSQPTGKAAHRHADTQWDRHGETRSRTKHYRDWTTARQTDRHRLRSHRLELRVLYDLYAYRRCRLQHLCWLFGTNWKHFYFVDHMTMSTRDYCFIVFFNFLIFWFLFF